MNSDLADLLAQASALAAELPTMEPSAPAALVKPGAATMLVEGVIGADVTVAGVRQMLAAMAPDAAITLHINSPGGYATEGFGIFNLLAQHRGPITARVDGVAASAASYILMAASRIEMPEASLLMIHNSHIVTIGNKEDHAASAEYLGKIDAMMARIYAARTGMDIASVSALMDAETWMDGPQAVAAGFADAVVDGAAARVPTTIDARALLAGFKAAPSAFAAVLSEVPSVPPPHVAAPPKETPMTEKTLAGAESTAPVVAIATGAELAHIATQAGLDLAWVSAQASALVTADAARAAALDAVAVAAASAPSRVRVTRDEGDTRRVSMEAALAVRTGRRVTADERAMAGGMAGWRMSDFARASVEAAGGKVSAASSVTVAAAALGIRSAMAAVGMHSTSDFPLLLANTANKSLRDAYESAPRTFTAFCRQAVLPDFKSISRVALGGAPQMLVVREGGEVEYGTVGEATESYSVLRYGRRIGVTFESIVNDDMSGFSRVPAMFGSAASRLESDTVYAIFNSNPNMSDAAALFVAGHNNVTTGVINVANLGAARTAMRKQTSPNGDILNLMPTYMLVPAELETLAASFLTQTVVPSAPGTTNVNPWAGNLTLIAEPRLSSALQYYLIANADQIDTIEYAYLAGMEVPTVTSYTDESTDGVVLKATHCFGAKAIDWRGMVRSSGA